MQERIQQHRTVAVGEHETVAVGPLVTKGVHELTVYNRSRAKAEAWVGRHKGRFADTPGKAAEGADIVFCCVGDDPDLRQVTLGPNGAFQKMDRGAIFVDHTTA